MIKPEENVVKAFENSRKNPKFAHDALEAVINDTPELAENLLKLGLVESAD